jgi:phosphoglycerol transferase
VIVTEPHSPEPEPAEPATTEGRNGVELCPLVRRPSSSAAGIFVDLLTLVAVVTGTLAVVFDLSGLRAPLAYAGDGLGVQTLVKIMIETGWVDGSPRLGAPLGQVLADYPVGGDAAHVAGLRVLTLFTKDWVLVSNLFLLLTFYTSAISSYLSMRWLAVSRLSAIATALLFSFAPFHFVRGISHLFLASYAVLPLGVVLALRVATEPLASGEGRARRIRSVLSIAALCAISASCGPYYMVFIAIVVGLTGVYFALASRSLRPLVRSVAAVVLMAVVFGINLSGSVLYRRSNGVNPLVAVRSPLEMDQYGLRVIQMLSPVPGHWLNPLANVSADLSAGIRSESSQFLGLTAAVSLVVMVAWALLSPLRERRDASDVRAVLPMLAVSVTAIATTGGASWYLSLIGFTQIRAWNRVSILVMFLSLLWLALTIDRLIEKLRARPGWGATRRSWAIPAMVTAGSLLGLSDQVSIDHDLQLPVWEVMFEADRDYFVGLEAAMSPGAAVFELPVRRFPEEAPTYGSGDYDLFRPYLQTRTTAWSYGGMKGRESEWQLDVTPLRGQPLVDALVATGFDGVLIDRFGYPDQGAELLASISESIGSEPRVSNDERWAFFALERSSSPASDATLDAVRSALLEAPRVLAGGCSGLEGEGFNRFQWCSQEVTLTVVRPGERGAVTVSFDAIAGQGTGTLTILAGETESRIAVSSTSLQAVSLEVPADVATITVRAEFVPMVVQGDPRELAFRLQGLTAEAQ